MALEINRAAPPTEGLTADRRLYLTADHRLVEEGSVEAAFQLAAPAALIPAAEVARLGLEMKNGKITQRVSKQAQAEPEREPEPEPKSAQGRKRPAARSRPKRKK